MTGQPFEFSAGDSMGYHQEAEWIVYLLNTNRFAEFLALKGSNYSDMGYSCYLAGIYSIIGAWILPIRIIKAFLGAYTCVLVYKLAGRNFGEATGRIAGILAMLSPNLIYYCGLHLKETEMLFLTLAFIERGDYLLRSQKVNFSLLLVVLLLGLSLFFFRTVLAGAAFGALGLAILFSSKVVLSFGRKVTFSIVIGIALLFMAGGAFQDNINSYLDDSDENQNIGMLGRSTRADGNKLAKYGSTAVFAPMIIAAPFPTLVNIETQQNQMMLNGGYFIKNILAFFTLLALVLLYKQKKLRQHLFIISFLLAYLGIIAMSTFALSERFHLPALPFVLILAGYGISHLKRVHARPFTIYLVCMCIIIIGWNWFKVAGRAM